MPHQPANRQSLSEPPVQHKAALVILAFVLVNALAGCGGIGPKTVPRDRFDYTETLSTSWKQQMLANMVKLRYGDAPVFLDVASVINQYSVETQVDLRLTWIDPTGDSQSTGGSARYTDKPTITYTPLSGERFARSLMKPLPPPALPLPARPAGRAARAVRSDHPTR